MIAISIKVPESLMIPELHEPQSLEYGYFTEEVPKQLQSMVNSDYHLTLYNVTPINPFAEIDVIRNNANVNLYNVSGSKETQMRIIIEFIKKSLKIQEYARRNREKLQQSKEYIQEYNTALTSPDADKGSVIPEVDFSNHRVLTSDKLPDTFDGQVDVMRTRLTNQINNQTDEAKKQKMLPTSDKIFVEYHDKISNFLRICAGRCHLRLFEMYTEIPEKELMDTKWLALSVPEREIKFDEFLSHMQNFGITGLKTVDGHIRNWTSNEITILDIIFEGKAPLFNSTALFVGEHFRDSLPLRINPNLEPSGKYYELGGGSSQPSRVDKEHAKTVVGNHLKKLLREFRNEKRNHRQSHQIIPLSF